MFFLNYNSAATAVAATLTAAPLFGAGTNLLQNASFEILGPPGQTFADWTQFVSPTSLNRETGPFPPPLAGNYMGKIFGNFDGNPSSDGVLFQNIAGINPGDEVTFGLYTHNYSGDAMLGDNKLFMALDFLDSGGGSISNTPLEVLSSSSMRDVWLLYSLTEIAPAGTASVNAVIVFNQQNNSGGAAFFDAASLMVVPVPEPGTYLMLGSTLLLPLARRRKTAQ